MPPLLEKRGKWLNQLNDKKIQDIPLIKYKILYNKMDQVLKKNSSFKILPYMFLYLYPNNFCWPLTPAVGLTYYYSYSPLLSCVNLKSIVFFFYVGIFY